MEAISYSIAREKMAETMDQVCDNHEIVIITRRGAKPVVMMSLEDYNAIQETAYLLKSPQNAERLRKSIKEAEEGKIVRKELIEK